jgi:hypothetical protein
MRLIAAHQATNAIANHNTAVAATLLPVLQHCTRPGTPAAILLPQIELLELTRTSLRGTSYLPAPSPEGIDQPGPPRGGLVSESLSWYLVQQSLLCGLQVLPTLALAASAKVAMGGTCILKSLCAFLKSRLPVQSMVSSVSRI